MKRLLALVVALAMVLSLLPMSVLASESDSSAEPEVTAVEEAPKAEPVEETVVDTTEPAEESKAEEETPAEEEKPAEETPAEEAPAEETSKQEETPAEEAPAEETPAEDASEQKAPEQETAVSYPAQTFQGKDNGVTVHVTADEGAFPEGTTMKVTKVTDKDVIDAVKDAVEGEVNTVKAVDVAFFNAEGTEIEPLKEIHVKLTSDVVKQAETPVVVHVDDEGEAKVIEETEVKKDAVEFDVDEFSVYAVVDSGSTAEEARATVNFISKVSNIATVYVKNSDTAEELKTIIYDPGVGTLDDGEMFLGWTLDKNYNADSKRMTVDDVRDYMEKLNIKEGDEVNFYAVISKVVTLTYLDEKGVALGSDKIQLIGSTTSGDVTVNMAYTPGDSEQDFEGWIVNSGKSNITKAVYNGSEITDGGTEAKPYRNDTVLTINGNVTLSVDAPKGHWLVFDENGKGATYNAPQFVKSGETTARPRPDGEMQRNGYTFGGWYTDQACTDGNEFTFGNELTESTTIYAKWTAKATANYTVLIWKQNVSGDGYDFAESISLSGRPNTAINTVTQQGTGNNAYARVNGVNKQYTGFHLKEFDQNVTIAPEGTAVVNVYYDRTEYTLKFQVYGAYVESTNGDYGLVNGNYVQLYQRYNGYYYGYYYYDYGWVEYTGTRYSYSSGWQTIKEIKALYQQNISDKFPIVGTNGVTYDKGERWKPQNDSVWKEVMVLIETMPSRDVTFHLDEASFDTKTMNFYVEALDTDTQTVTYNSKKFTLYNTVKANYNGVTEEDYLDLLGYTKYAVADPQGHTLTPSGSPAFYKYNGNKATTVNFYYTRNKYPILYLDGVYVDGNGNPVEGYSSQGELKKVEDVIYGSDTSSYNKDGANYYAPTFGGFVFAGWYTDNKCTQPYTFTTMPEGGITVYAKWVQVQYRVFLHPNAGTDPTLDWGSENQAMTFRISNGGKVSAPTGTRGEYEMIGWYLDEACTKVFNADAYILNDTTVTADYDKTKDMTDPMDKWGNGATTNADVNRPWITRKLDVYAKWRAVLVGADGIGVIYDANGGSNAPHDTTLYLDRADAVAQAASTAPEGKQFSHWVVQKWNGSEYEDTDVTVEPGATYTVLKANAKVETKEGSTPENPAYSYTVQLKAVYVNKEVATPTHIRWYSNLQDVDSGSMKLDEFTTTTTTNDDIGGWYFEDKADGTLQINEAVDIRPATTFKYGDYTFLGWAKKKDAKESELFLKYEDGGFKAKNADGDWVKVTQVAADENQPYDDLYAVWKAKFYVYHSSTTETVAYDMVDSFDITSVVKDGYLYGGYYSEYADKGTEYTGETSSWDSSKAYTVKGTEMKPAAGTTYYLKEVPEAYAQASNFDIWHTKTDIEKQYYLVTTIDDANYSATGFKIGAKMTDYKSTLSEKVHFNYDDTATPDFYHSDELTAANFNNVKGGLVAHVMNNKIIETAGASITYRPYYTTLDGVTVYGKLQQCAKSNRKIDPVTHTSVKVTNKYF